MSGPQFRTKPHVHVKSVICSCGELFTVAAGASDPVAGLREAADEFHKWLCKTARFSPTGAWGNEVRSRLAALLAEPVPLDVERRLGEVLIAMDEEDKTELVEWRDLSPLSIASMIAARLTDPRGATDDE